MAAVQLSQNSVPSCSRITETILVLNIAGGHNISQVNTTYNMLLMLGCWPTEARVATVLSEREVLAPGVLED